MFTTAVMFMIISPSVHPTAKHRYLMKTLLDGKSGEKQHQTQEENKILSEVRELVSALQTALLGQNPKTLILHFHQAAWISGRLTHWHPISTYPEYQGSRGTGAVWKWAPACYTPPCTVHGTSAPPCCRAAPQEGTANCTGTWIKENNSTLIPLFSFLRRRCGQLSVGKTNLICARRAFYCCETCRVHHVFNEIYVAGFFSNFLCNCSFWDLQMVWLGIFSLFREISRNRKEHCIW